MAGINRVARRVALSAGVALVAAFAVAVPLKPAAADDDWHGQWHGDGNDDEDGWDGGGSYYRAPGYYYAPPPVYYYPPPPVYYAPPRAYYPPAPVYGPPGISLDFVIPLQFR